MKQKVTILLVFVMLFFSESYAQTEDKITIAILPFINKTNSEIAGKVSSIEEMVTSEFTQKKRFVVLDRGKFDKLMAEQNTQKGEVFLNSKVIEQGKVIGAQYLIAGVVSEYEMKQVVVKDPVDYSNPNAYRGTHYENRYSLKISFQLIKVETGQSISNTTIDKEDFKDETTLLCNTKRDVKKEIRKLFPIEMKILQVEKIDKKGMPDKVLVSGGSEMFGSGKEVSCPGENSIGSLLTTGLFGGSTKTILSVYVIEKVGEYDREKEIGQLKLEKTEGELAICDVKKGAKEIQEKLNEGKKLLVKIIKN